MKEKKEGNFDSEEGEKNYTNQLIIGQEKWTDRPLECAALAQYPGLSPEITINKCLSMHLVFVLVLCYLFFLCALLF